MIIVVIALIALPVMIVVWVWWPGRRDGDIAGPLVVVIGVVTCAVGWISEAPIVGLIGLMLLAIGVATAAVVRKIGARR
jgi:hypothetical protein